MRRLLLAAILCSGCSLFKLPTPQPTPPKVDVVSRAVASTVALVTPEGRFCSGVITEGIVATAYHCVVSGLPFSVESGGKEYPSIVVRVDAANDLALVTPIGLRIRSGAPLAEDGVNLGQRVVWLGYPLAGPLRLGVGVVAGTEDAHTFAVQGQLLPGNSGGPMFNEFGELIGIVSETLILPGVPTPQFLPEGVVVRVSLIRALLENDNPPTPE